MIFAGAMKAKLLPKENDIDGMRNYKGNNMWALFGDREMAYWDFLSLSSKYLLLLAPVNASVYIAL